MTAKSLYRMGSIPAGGAALLATLWAGPLAAQGIEEVRRVTLEEAIRTARRTSPALEQALANIRQSETQRTSAFGAFLPSVNLGYSYSDASTGRLDPTGQSITATSWTTQLSASYDILDGLRRYNQLQNARKNVAAQVASYEQQRYQAELAVKTAFYDAVAAGERVQVERDRVERQLEQLDFVRQQIQLGQATRADSLQSRVDLNDARLALLNAQNDARAAQFALAEAMGVEYRLAPALEIVPEPDTVRLELERLMQIAQRQAPRIRSARRSLEAAESNVKTQKSPYFPSLRFSGGFDWRNSDFPPKGRSWSLRLSGSLPLFDGLQREAGVARARAQVTATEAQLRLAELAVRSDVDDAYSGIETALAGLRLAEESVELSRENLRVNQQRYRFGTATILDLQQAQINLEQAQVSVIQRKFDYQVGVARLESLLGMPLTSPGAAAAEPGGAASGTNDRTRP